MVEQLIQDLLTYAQYHLGSDKKDEIYLRNYLFEQFGVSSSLKCESHLEDIKKMNIPDSLILKMEKYFKSFDLDEKEIERKIVMIMGTLTPLPSKVIENFFNYYKTNPLKATDYLYYISIKNDYVKKSKIDKNIVWLSKFKDYELEVTINLTKPEKDNKDIKKLANAVVDENAYPQCVLCIENEGCYGRKKTPPRGNLRLIPLELNNSTWYLQYSPYGYYSEHCILIQKEHSPMKVCKDNLKVQLEFVKMFPHYFLGSNSDLPIVGGSILNHEHFQGGRHVMPMMKAKIKESYEVKHFKDLTFSRLLWPSAAFLLTSKDQKVILEAGDKFFRFWREYDDISNNIIHKTSEQHNTITTIARYENGLYYLYLLPRNNRVDEVSPDGIFHVRKSLHFIKKEGIGLIEAMGLFILPPRLKRQLGLVNEIVKDYSKLDEILKNNEDLKPFLGIVTAIKGGYASSPEHYISLACKAILEDISVFKNNETGEKGLLNFVKRLSL